MAYTIKLIGLECFQAEEIDGDEIFIKLNGEKVWESPDKMNIARPEALGQPVRFCRWTQANAGGWVPLMPYDPHAFLFHRSVGRFRCCNYGKTDTLTSDDLLGQTPIDASQASGGSISVVFQRLGAHYRLTYKVEAERRHKIFFFFFFF